MACEEGMETGGISPSDPSPDHIRKELKDAQGQLLWLAAGLMWLAAGLLLWLAAGLLLWLAAGLMEWKEGRAPERQIGLFRPQFEEDVRQN